MHKRQVSGAHVSVMHFRDTSRWRAARLMHQVAGKALSVDLGSDSSKTMTYPCKGPVPRISTRWVMQHIGVLLIRGFPASFRGGTLDVDIQLLAPIANCWQIMNPASMVPSW